MSQNLPDDQIEIINDFLQESRDMLDHLEPTIIELGQSCQNVDCWETLACSNHDCPRHGKTLLSPCWLDQGCVGEGAQACAFAEAESDCRSCRVFELINGNGDTMNAIFRLFHSMKGSAGFLEFDNISHVAHQAENLLDLIRSGKVKLELEHVDLLCQSCDFSRAALEYVEKNFDDRGMVDLAEEIAGHLQVAVQTAQDKAQNIHQPPAEEIAAEAGSAEAAEAEKPFEVYLPGIESLITPELMTRFVQEGDELLQESEQGLLAWTEEAQSVENIAQLFRSIHSFKGNCGFFGFADMEKLSHQIETILDAAKAGVDFGACKPQEVLLQMLDVLRSGIADIADGGKGMIADLDSHLQVLQEIVDRTCRPASETGQSKPAPSAAPKAISAPAKNERAEAPASGGRPQLAIADAPEKKTGGNGNGGSGNGKGGSAAIKRQDIRVDLEKLDKLINLIGEMVIAENMLVNNPDLVGLELENFGKASQQMSKIVRELQEMAMAIRMIPVSGLFRRMIRLVHDISVKSGKKVELELYGEETEVDKTVIEQITDPLVHLLRNSLDHGLEPPQERLAAGKTEKGVVRLSAKHEEGEVWITVVDDGRGLNREKILAKAISKGLIQGDGTDMNDRAVFNLIFQPGFSTAEKITDISGRGVGMDVVKQNLEKI
jgi:two-component system, chemotaxis family, sensor kinase CheA